MINLLKSIFKQEKIELIPTGINLLEPMRIDDGWTFKFVYPKHLDFFDE